MSTIPAPAEYTATRLALQRVATHVAARARYERTGRFGLRVLPGGFGTPAFGPHERVLRVSGPWFLSEWREDGRPSTAAVALSGATLAELAVFAGVTLTDGFSAGHDTPPLGDIDEPLTIDGAAGTVFAAWMIEGAAAVDQVVARLGTPGEATVLQLWPEHFDAGLDVATPAGRCNVGISPGDGFSDEPYAYVGPWEAARPGSATYWNAPFGAVATAGALAAEGDLAAALDGFFTEGLAQLGARP